MTYEIKDPENATYFVAYSDGVSHVGVVFPLQTVSTGQPNFYSSEDPQEFLDQTRNIPMPDLPELPQDESPIECGVYAHNGTRVIVTEAQGIIYPSAPDQL